MNNRLSIQHMDLGYDPREVDEVCIIPYWCNRVFYDSKPIDGISLQAPEMVTGTQEEILTALREAGYKVRGDVPDFHHPALDGTRVRILTSGVLEHYNPNNTPSTHRWCVWQSAIWHTELPGGGNSLSAELLWERIQNIGDNWPLLDPYISWANDRRVYVEPIPRVVIGTPINPEAIIVKRLPSGGVVMWKRGEGYSVADTNNYTWVDHDVYSKPPISKILK